MDPRLIAAACLVSTVLLISPPARACMGPPAIARTPEERLHEFDVIARGTVKSFHSRTPVVDGRWAFHDDEFWGEVLEVLPPGYDTRIVIEVDEAWKGVTFDEIVVMDDGPDSCCGMWHVEVGEEVLVYAREREGGFWINGPCAPIIRIADAQADLDYLGPGQRELRSKALQRAWVGLAVALPILFGGLLLWRRRGQSLTQLSS